MKVLFMIIAFILFSPILVWLIDEVIDLFKRIMK